jgi:hypothetical protein
MPEVEAIDPSPEPAAAFHRSVSFGKTTSEDKEVLFSE